jgi:DNA polymerase III subunit delta'
VTRLYGHEAAVADFRAALDGGRLHHAWLIAGPRGIGKGSFARQAALRLLVEAVGPKPQAPGLEVDPDHPAAKLAAAESHPDLHLIEREVWDKKGNLVPKSERSGTEELARSIRIVQIRWLSASLAKTASMSSRQAVIVDPADDLETGAANALLKNLEEPPANTIFFLVSHSPERLLPTIRSRCRVLRLAPLKDDAMASALRAALPDADEGEIDSLVAAGEGAPGRAVAFRGLDVAALDRAMEVLAREGDPTNGRRSALAQSLSLKSAQPRYETFLARAPALIAREARARRGAALAEALRLWERASVLAGGATRLSLDAHSTVFELAGMLAALAPAEGRDAA